MKIQINLLAKHPKQGVMEIVDEQTGRHSELVKNEVAHEGEEESIKEVAQREGKQIQIDRQQAVKGFPTKFLASGRVVGDFKAWNVVKDNRINSRPKKK
ncbi:hypothetical protein KY289_036356 [Solanum tuberosum]|nr:hypothetical protein KY289_036356 [Solanum tuberosum]